MIFPRVWQQLRHVKTTSLFNRHSAEGKYFETVDHSFEPPINFNVSFIPINLFMVEIYYYPAYSITSNFVSAVFQIKLVSEFFSVATSILFFVSCIERAYMQIICSLKKSIYKHFSILFKFPLGKLFSEIGYSF